jgi:hormone-sensitive lipase
LDCPVISIDYSLAPENPFPRPTEEVLYAYTWILNNPEKFGLLINFIDLNIFFEILGWTGEKICMVGDSAGGNLIVSVSLRLVELGAKRMPDGLIPIYTPFLFQVTRSYQFFLKF